MSATNSVCWLTIEVDGIWNVMAHAQKPDFLFRRNGRVYLNRRGRQFSRLLAAEVCASAVVMLDTPCSEVVWRVLATHSIRQFPTLLPLPCVTVCHHISTGVLTQNGRATDCSTFRAGWRVPQPLRYKALRSAETFGSNIPARNVKVRTWIPSTNAVKTYTLPN